MVTLHTPDTKLFMVEPTRELCDAAEKRLVRSAAKLALASVVVRIGYNEASQMDHLHEFVDKKLAEECAQSMKALAAVDKCIALLMHGHGTPVEHTCLSLIRALLAKRHAFLDQTYYRERAAKGDAILAAVRVFVLTPTKLAEIHGGQSEWSCLLGGTAHWGLIADEYQRYFWKLIVAMALRCSFAILTGDVHQGTPHTIPPPTRNVNMGGGA